MLYRSLYGFASLLYVLPFFVHLDAPLYITLDCPACAYTLHKSPKERVYLIDASIEINCLLKKIHETFPEKQIAFLEFYHKNPSHLRLKEFCESEQIPLETLQPCKNCTEIWQLELQEILYYVMRYGISTVPFGGKNRESKNVRA